MPDRRVALITGGAGAIGACVAAKLAGAGIQVIAADCSAAKEHPLQISSGPAATWSVAHVDVTDEGSVATLFATIDRACSRLDMVINCAGVSPRLHGQRPSVEQTPLHLWQQTLAINLTGTFLICRAAVPRMKGRGWGRIVNIASLAGRAVGPATSSYYAASKSGVLGFSRVLASEVGRYGITVNCVSPSRIQTPMAKTLQNAATIDEEYVARTPMGRIGRVEDVVSAISFFLSEEADFVTGSILDVTGGYFMP